MTGSRLDVLIVCDPPVEGDRTGPAIDGAEESYSAHGRRLAIVLPRAGQEEPAAWSIAGSRRNGSILRELGPQFRTNLKCYIFLLRFAIEEQRQTRSQLTRNDFSELRYWRDRESEGSRATLLSRLLNGAKVIAENDSVLVVNDGFKIHIKPPADGYEPVYQWMGLPRSQWPDAQVSPPPHSTPCVTLSSDAVDRSAGNLATSSQHHPIACPAGAAASPRDPSSLLHEKVSPRIFDGGLPPTDPGVFGREEELRLLDEAWDDPRKNIVSIVEIGGAGKSALVNHWLNERMDGYGGARNVLTWSFAKQGGLSETGAGEDDFFQFVWEEFFKETSPSSNSPRVQALRLADRLRKERTLLVLDGLESLLNHQGLFHNPAYDVLLQQLAVNMNGGLCILLTRPPFLALRNRTNHSVIMVDSLRLSAAAGRKLLRRIGVKGSPANLERAVEAYQGHALALTLLGTLLVSQFDGHIHHRDKVRLTEQELADGDYARAMIRSHALALTPQERSIFRALSLYDRPAKWSSLLALLAGEHGSEPLSRLKSLTERDINALVFKLLPTRLLIDNRAQRKTLELHPIVRDYFSAEFKEQYPTDFRLAHGCLFDYFCRSTAQRPESLTELQPLYQAIWHGCQADRHEEALNDVFQARIRRGDEHYSLERLGAVGCDLSAMACFFEHHWSKPAPGLSSSTQWYLHSEVGLLLNSTGQMADALTVLWTAFKLAEADQEWARAANELGDMAGLYRHIDLVKALEFGDKTLSYRQKIGEPIPYTVTLGGRARTLYLQGKVQEAALEFEKVRLEMLKIGLPAILTDGIVNIPVSVNVAAYRLCQYWLDLNQTNPALDFSLTWLPHATHGGKLSIALHRLNIARALQAHARHDEACQLFNQAIEGLYLSGREEYLVEALLYRAAFFLAVGNLSQAQLDLVVLRHPPVELAKAVAGELCREEFAESVHA